MASEPLTLEQVCALVREVIRRPPPPHHYALAPDVMEEVRQLGTPASGTGRDDTWALRALTGVELREDATLPPRTWEPRNRDGSPWPQAPAGGPEGGRDER